MAELLDTTVASVNSALQRARATLAASDLGDTGAEEALDDEQRVLLDRYVDAFERYDMDALTACCTRTRRQSMPPYACGCAGREDILRLVAGSRGPAAAGPGWSPPAANGAPAFAQYQPERARWGAPAVGAAGPADLRRPHRRAHVLPVHRLAVPPFGLPEDPAELEQPDAEPGTTWVSVGPGGRAGGRLTATTAPPQTEERRGWRSVAAGAVGDLPGAGPARAFDTGHRRMSLTQMAARAQMPMATAHRLVAELVAWGALVRRPDGAYEVGHRLWTLGLLAPVQGELREVAAPFLQDLYAATGDTVHLAVREGDRGALRRAALGKASVPVVSQVGGRLPLHTTGVGKVLLAHAPPDVRPARAGAPDPRDASLGGPAGPDGRELAEVRRRGYARTAEEMSLGACSVAVPVHDVDGAVVAAVGRGGHRACGATSSGSCRRCRSPRHGIARHLRQFH